MILEVRRLTVDRKLFVGFHRTAFIDRFSHHVDDPPQGGRPHGHGDGCAGIDHFLAAHQAFGGIHSDGPDGGFAEMLRYLQDQALALVFALDGV